MTRTVLFLVLGCCVVTAAIITAILEADGPISAQETAGASVALSDTPLTPDKDRKQDRLPVISPSESVSVVEKQPRLDFAARSRMLDPLREAYASDSPLSPGAASEGAVPIPPAGPLQKLRPTKTPPQKNYSLLSDAQISAIKSRLKLTPAQEAHWPAVETSLRKVARTIHERRLASASPPIDPLGPEVGELRSVATPLLAKLREDQKREVRTLARIIGLDAAASQL